MAKILCPDCKAPLREGLHPLELKVGERSFTVEVSARLCGACGGGGVDAPVLERAYLELAGELARAGQASPEVFRFQRKALGLTASELGELLGVIGNTVTRWENKERALDHGAAALLGRLVLDALAGRTDMLDQLRAMKAPREVPTNITTSAEGAR